MGRYEAAIHHQISALRDLAVRQSLNLSVIDAGRAEVEIEDIEIEPDTLAYQHPRSARCEARITFNHLVAGERHSDDLVVLVDFDLRHGVPALTSVSPIPVFA